MEELSRNPKLVGTTAGRYSCSIAKTARLEQEREIYDGQAQPSEQSSDEEETNYFKNAQW
jgi:hypothetical protein